MRSEFKPLLPLLTLLAGLHLSAYGEVPPRSDPGQTLEVPESHLDLGNVYYVWPGEDSQIVVTNQARERKLSLTSSRVIGYFVAPFEMEEGGPPILAGGLRVPSVSLVSGTDQAQRRLQSAAFLDAANHREMGFEFVAIEGVKSTGSSEEGLVFEARMKGRLVVKGSPYDIEIPVTLEFRPLSFASTRGRVAYDEHLAIRGSFSIKPVELGWEPNARLKPSIADELTVDMFLMLSSVSPDSPGDPRVEPAKYHKMLRFTTLLRDLDDPVQGYRLGESLLSENRDDPDSLNQLASIVLSTSGIERRNLDFALRAATRAAELSRAETTDVWDETPSSALENLALAHYLRGDVAKALELQQQVVEKNKNERRADSLKATLEKYRKEAVER